MFWTRKRARPQKAAAPTGICLCGGELELFVQNGLTTRSELNGFISDIHHCRSCDHLQFYPLPPSSLLNEHYQTEFFSGGAEPFTAEVSYLQWAEKSDLMPQRLFTNLIESLKAANWPEQRPDCHDFGCGYGALVVQMSDLGFAATGTDLSAEAVRAGREKGADISVGGIAELAKRESAFDLITAYHCVEHLPSPGEFFQAANRALKPGGLIVLALPNGAYAPARKDYFGQFDWCFFPGHLHYFSPRSLKRAAAASGFEIIHLESNSLSDTQLDWASKSTLSIGYDQLVDPHEFRALLDHNLLARDLRAVARKSASPGMSSSLPQIPRASPEPYRSERKIGHVLCSIAGIECRDGANILFLSFKTSRQLPRRCKVALHAQNGPGDTWAKEPFRNLDFWPDPETEKWEIGQEIQLSVPLDLQPGSYRLRVGLYDIERRALYRWKLAEIGTISLEDHS